VDSLLTSLNLENRDFIDKERSIVMKNTLKKSGKVCIIFFIILIFYTFLPRPLLAFDNAYINSLGMEFILIPAGTFIMGSPSNEPYRNKDEVQHKVTISEPFYIQATEVTLKQWRALMGRKLFGRRRGADNMPVVKVSWHDCLDFIKKLNALSEWSYRLPTEAEWEYACRAESSTAYSWGNTIDCGKAMYSNNSLKSKECLDYIRSRELTIDQPAPVKSYPPNAWGLYGMHGNVWEWCQDWYGDYAINAKIGPLGPDSGTMRVRRGGSWFLYGYSCRSANRNCGHPSSRYQTIGFRLVGKKVPDQIYNEEGR
jgi:formylglycine-generating enzyme required for sulfatase activity